MTLKLTNWTLLDSELHSAYSPRLSMIGVCENQLFLRTSRFGQVLGFRTEGFGSEAGLESFILNDLLVFRNNG
jgi:hypothetical protein